MLLYLSCHIWLCLLWFRNICLIRHIMQQRIKDLDKNNKLLPWILRSGFVCFIVFKERTLCFVIEERDLRRHDFFLSKDSATLSPFAMMYKHQPTPQRPNFESVYLNEPWKTWMPAHANFIRSLLRTPPYITWWFSHMSISIALLIRLQSTSREAMTVLCSVKSTQEAARARKKCREKHKT